MQIKTATTIFSQSNAPYIFLYNDYDDKIEGKGRDEGGKTLKGKTSTTAMNKLPIQATAWSPQLPVSLKQMAGARKVELRRYG